jgi:hypothetical protein
MFLPLDFPPGIFRNGTEYEAKGRWRDGNLVRFLDGTKRPIGGWRVKSTSAVTGKARAIVTWKDNSLVTWAGIGTHSKLYAMSRTGGLSDITPAGFTAGIADATSGGGFGAGSYGAGIYGTPRPDTTLIQDATVWSLDTWGEHLVGCTVDDGKIYEWSLATANPAVQVTNSPTARSVFVTEERVMMALGAASNPRKAQWSDAENNTVWTPSATNQAGDLDLQTAGKLMLGRKIRGGNLIWTDLDVWLATYTADNFVYRFTKLADHTGAVSQNCAAVLDASAVWMGRSGFWLYNGFVSPLLCEVSDYVFSDINALQISKVTCYVNSAYGEVTWHYPSGGSNEIDRYVSWDYLAYARGQNVWTIGSLVRLCGADRGAMAYPLLVGSDGYVNEHEVGFSYDGATPYLESGPFELAPGEKVMYVKRLIPDEKTAGDVTATFKTKLYPNGAETSSGPYALGSPTDVRFSGRSAKLRYAGSRLADWRVGVPRLELVEGGRR